MARTKGFAKHGNGKAHPITEKKGIKESDMNISVKGNNDRIRVVGRKEFDKDVRNGVGKNVKVTDARNHESQMLEGKNFEQRNEIPISPMNLAGEMIEVPFEEGVWLESLEIAKKNKQWAEEHENDKEWNAMASEVSKNALKKYLDLSVREQAIDYYQYWYMRSHVPVRSMYGNLGDKAPIDPEWADRWEKATGKKITQADFIKLKEK